jgi:hypothetical protein
MTVQVQPPQEVKTDWYRDHRPWTRITASVTGDFGAIRNHAVDVGIAADSHPFPQIQALLDRAEQWKRVAEAGRVAAGQEVEAARVRAVAAETVTLEALNAFVDVVEQTRRWWDSVPMNVDAARPGREASAAQAANTLYAAERWQAGQILNQATDRLYALFAERARAAVEQVEGVLPLPPRAWAALEPVNVLAPDTRETLQEAERVMNACHFMALYLRSMGVPGTDAQLLGDEPVEGLTFRRWSDFNARRHELDPIRQPLKLAFAVQAGWQPGLWLASDLRGVDQGPGSRRFIPVWLRRSEGSRGRVVGGRGPGSLLHQGKEEAEMKTPSGPHRPRPSEGGTTVKPTGGKNPVKK